jgi:hypothetical protein
MCFLGGFVQKCTLFRAAKQHIFADIAACYMKCAICYKIIRYIGIICLSECDIWHMLCVKKLHTAIKNLWGGGEHSLAAEKWDTVRDSGTVTLLCVGYKSLCGMLRTAMHTGWKRNTTDSWASKYNNFRETKMNPGKCCTLRIENTGELGACSMPTGPQLQNKDTNQSVQKKEKRKQHILALQRE